MKEVMEKGEDDPFFASLYGGFYDEADDKVHVVCLMISFRTR